MALTTGFLVYSWNNRIIRQILKSVVTVFILNVKFLICLQSTSVKTEKLCDYKISITENSIRAVMCNNNCTYIFFCYYFFIIHY